LKDYVNSHKDLPLYIYQIQTKFRNELRAKSGILRGREFLMKDLYSFSKTEAEFKEFYEKCAESYLKIYERVGLGGVTYRTVASGGAFTTEFTDEFQVLTDAGEDTIYVDEKKKLAVNKEVYSDDTLKKVGLEKDNLVEKKAIEVGNIFPLGTKYSEALNLKYKDEGGNDKAVIMGSYGIGLGRLMGTVVEVMNDEKGIIWPESISPFRVHLISIGAETSKEVKGSAEGLYKSLTDIGMEVLFDDRELRAGEKFADSDLIGIPTRVIVSQKTLEGGKFEVKDRKTGEIKMMSEEEVKGLN